MERIYRDFLIRDWERSDREAVASLVRDVLLEFGLPWQPEHSDRDVIAVEEYYLSKNGGEFWVIEKEGKIVGTVGYYPIERGDRAVEIRKMYFHRAIRGQGLGKFILQQLETAIAAREFQEIWLETATVFAAAIRLYEHCGYQQATGVETPRCDRVYRKKI